MNEAVVVIIKIIYLRRYGNVFKSFLILTVVNTASLTVCRSIDPLIVRSSLFVIMWFQIVNLYNLYFFTQCFITTPSFHHIFLENICVNEDSNTYDAVLHNAKYVPQTGLLLFCINFNVIKLYSDTLLIRHSSLDLDTPCKAHVKRIKAGGRKINFWSFLQKSQSPMEKRLHTRKWEKAVIYWRGFPVRRTTGGIVICVV